MLKLKILISILFNFFFLNSCALFFKQGLNSGNNPLLAFGGLFYSSSTLPSPIDVTTPPSIAASPSLGGASSTFVAEPSTQKLPFSVEGNYVPIGKIYNIGLDWSKVEGIQNENFQMIKFNDLVEIKYTYDSDALLDSGFIEEFMVFYFDSEQQTWIPVKGVRVDTDKKEVIAITDHFTPFVITALPAPQGTGVVSPPACIKDEAPLSGSANADWTRFDINFKYYKDRNYIIKPNADFYNLGFENSLGIATCNGGASAGFNNCGSFAEHKNFDGTNYIQFKAPKKITVYLMYDNRGPVDSPWLVNEGWFNTGLLIETTDAVGSYKVYAKNYDKDQMVNIHGNRNGITLPTNINTNLWVVVKPQGSNLPNQSTEVCNNPTNSIAYLDKVKGIPGSDRNTILWEIPKQSNIQNVLIRRQLNFPTLSPSGGDEVSGIEHLNYGFTDLGLTVNTTYYYTLFTVDSDGEYSPGKVIEITTGVDQDSDGIKDGYELNPDNIYDSGLPSIFTKSDSDEDGINDLQEIINETDPRNPDSIKPEIQLFSLSTSNPTQMPIAMFNLTGTDNIEITHWILREGNKKPRKNDSDWQVSKPDHKILSELRAYIFYVWAKDAAGNISNVANSVNVTLDGLKYPKYLFAAKYGTSIIQTYQYNLATKSLDLLSSYDAGGQNITQILVHPTNKFLIASTGNGIQTLDIGPDGKLLNVSFIARMQPIFLIMDREGKFLYSSETEMEDNLYYTFFRTYQIVEVNRTLLPHSRYKFGRDLYEMVLHPMNDKFVSGVVQGSDFGDSCYYGLNTLNNGVVSSQYGLNGVNGDGCSGAVIDNSGRYIYTVFFGANGSSIKPFVINNGSAVAYSTAWSLNVDSSASRPQIIVHPNGINVYVLRGNSSGTYVDTYEIDSNVSNEGRLNPIGLPFYIGSGDAFFKATLDVTGNVLFISHQNRNISTVQLDSITKLPMGVSSINNVGWYLTSLSINNQNEPPVSEAKLHPNLSGYVGINRYDYLFKDFCLIGDIKENNFYFINNLCHGLIKAKDFDATRCNTSTSSLTVEGKISGVAPDKYNTSYDIDQNTIFYNYSFIATTTGNYNLEYTVTDQSGDCTGGSKTTIKNVPIKVKKLIAGPLIRIPVTENLTPTPFKQFLLQSNAYSQTTIIKRCEFLWHECSLTIEVQQDITNPILRFGCESKSKIISYNASVFGGNASCQSRFQHNSPGWIFLYRARDLGIYSIINYINGRWLEVTDRN